MGKENDLLKAAVPLFANLGFDATTTLAISQAAGVTEPVIYYHYKNKDGLFTHILSVTFAEYFARFDALEKNPPTQFEKIENLIDLHFKFVDDFPEEIYIILSACPAKLKDPAHVCTKLIEKQKKYLSEYLSDCLNKGIQSKEFTLVPVDATAGLIIAMVNGLLRRRSLQLDRIEGLKKTTVEFCRRSLLAND